MSNHDILYSFNLKKAITMDLITDYHVVGVIYEGLISDEFTNLVSSIAQVITQKDCKRVIIYHKYYQAKQHNAKSFFETWSLALMRQLKRHGNTRSVDYYLIGSGEAKGHNANVLDRMRVADEGIVIVSNSQMITEGIDIPSVDCVVFLDDKQSKKDIV